ncbi:hypothetical protein CERSUDRAFT_159915 [Gelatoporia subvermispora B]|uniref:Protein kinase domain-containing protein n=1 Tax=Ceriporiopsis subvermispora (strain B) TaxID=914234 RepID=M2R684_CERS8|nr:hypothetical protein CERSUDRAFT_159915 [Gelatoporia subvermispora B]
MRRHCIYLVKRLCSSHGIYPRSFRLPVGHVQKQGEAVSFGGFGDVWRGDYNGRAVAIKELRPSTNGRNSLDALKILCKEAAIWKYLDHPNVTKFHGVIALRGCIGLVSTWMENGTLQDYLNTKLDSDRFELIKNVIDGLCYLHEILLCHGDLKALNILVDKHGIASLTDFGLAAFSYNEQTQFIMETSVQSMSTRWAPPELVDPTQFDKEKATPSPQSDVYSFAWVMWEVFTGRCPFYGTHPHAVYGAIMKGIRPARPTQAESIGLSKQVWKLMERCWNHHEAMRPSMSLVQQRFKEISEERKIKTPGVPRSWPLEI